MGTAGHAIEAPETIRDLYAHAAQRWVDAGAAAHFAMTPAGDGELIDAWFRLGFGLQHVHALRPPGKPADRRRAPFGAEASRPTVRRAAPDDVDALAGLDLVLDAHQARSPVFSPHPVPAPGPARAAWLDRARTDWLADLADPESAAFAVEVDGRVVAAALGCPLERSSTHTWLARPPRAGFLGFAAVLPQARGLGIGRLLGETVLDWITESGFTCAAIDWRSANVLASRAWPRLGFSPSFLRLHRLVGH